MTISDNIYSDYKDLDTGDYFTYMDFEEESGYYKWWEDYEFLSSISNEEFALIENKCKEV